MSADGSRVDRPREQVAHFLLWKASTLSWGEKRKGRMMHSSARGYKAWRITH